MPVVSSTPLSDLQVNKQQSASVSIDYGQRSSDLRCMRAKAFRARRRLAVRFTTISVRRRL